MKRGRPLRRYTSLRRREALVRNARKGGASPEKVARLEGWLRARESCLARANYRCEAKVEGICEVRARDAHHLVLRSAGGADDEANLLAVCRACHRWAHEHPASAIERGLIWTRRALPR